MKAKDLTELGWKVCGELIDELNNRYLFVVENNLGDWMILHFYVASNNIHMVEGFYDRSLNDYFYYFLFDNPNKFLESFDKFRMYIKPDWYDTKDNWINEQREFLMLLKKN